MALKPLDLLALTVHHSHHLRCLVGEPRTPVIRPTASKAIVLVALQAAAIELLQTIALIAPIEADQRPVCGVWTLQDLLGHLADWDTYFGNWLAGLTDSPQQDLYWDDDGDQFNAWLNAQRRGESWAKSWSDFRQNRQQFHQHLVTIPDAKFFDESKDGPFPTVYHCAWSALEHYLDHAAGLRRERQLQLSDELLTFHGPYTD